MPPLFFDAFTRFGAKPKQHKATQWKLEHLVDEMRHCSVSGALVCHAAQTTYDLMLENRRLLERIKPYDFLFPIWNVMPHWTGEMPQPSDLIQMMSDHNVRAVMVQPGTNGWDITSRSSKPLLDELERTRTLTILEPAEVSFSHIEQLLLDHPQLPVLMRGVSWRFSRLAMPLLLNHKNLHIGFDTFQVNYAIEWLAKQGCQDQMVYCSNATDMSMGAHRCYVDYADVPEAVKSKIAGGNLTRLLKGIAPPREMINDNEDAIMTQARHGQPLTTPVLDFHAHMLDEGCQGAGGSYLMLDGGPSGTHRLAQRMGVDAMGIMSWNGTVSVQAKEGNDCVTAALDAYPDFYWGLGTFDVIHCTAQEMRNQMETLYSDKRFLGLKPYPMYGIPYSDSRYDCWWQFGNDRKLYCGLHPVNWYQPGEFESICSRFPDLTVVAYHCGGSFEIADTMIALTKKFPNLYLEITLTPSWCGIIEYLVQGAGADRVLYGSDLPMRDPRQQLGWVVFSRLNIEDKKKVLGSNGQRILDHVRKHNPR